MSMRSLAVPAREALLQRERGDDRELRAAVVALLRADSSHSHLGEDRLASVRKQIAPVAEAAPDRLGVFRITGVLGRGGNGDVGTRLSDGSQNAITR